MLDCGILVERISIECYETKFHVITVANQKKDKHHKGPMGTQSRNNLTAWSAGKRELLLVPVLHLIGREDLASL